uniref:Uncharacterized protein n=1 Tax=Pseudomonas putida (strain ATCC 700007 / DSM 6899 / JCM 31910 / BCRC 17059 / LMG 24140 / F1) TaxID=351746 RepID=A5WB13_PSEP1
MMFLDTALG